MIASVQLADIGALAVPSFLRRRLRPADVPGMLSAQLVLGADLGPRVRPTPRLGRVGLVASWEDDAALDAFLADHPLAEALADGWQVRLAPLRISGFWSGMPDVPREEQPVADEEPVAVLTLGNTRLRRIVPFLRTSAAAEGQAIADPALLASTGLARPPRFVSTFSLWRSAAGMRAYAYGKTGPSHLAAIHAERKRSFHHESAFVRFRPYASRGSWDGRDPLALPAGAVSAR